MNALPAAAGRVCGFGNLHRSIILFAIFGVVLCASTPRSFGQVFWDGGNVGGDVFSGSWNDALNWNTNSVPNSPLVDVQLRDLFTGGDIIPPSIYDSDVYDPATPLSVRVVTLDAAVDVRSLLIQEFPFPQPPPITGAPHRNVLQLNAGLTAAQDITLSGSRALFDLNGQTVSADHVVVEAPYFDPTTGTYWFRNRIAANISLNDGLNSDLGEIPPLPGPPDPPPTSPGNAFPVLPGPLTSQGPIAFSTNYQSGANVPVTGANGATVGTIDAELDSQGIVWLRGSSHITQKVTNHSAFGYFRYDSLGVDGDFMLFDGPVVNSDQCAIMDINGRGFYQSTVRNQNLGTMYLRSRSDLRSTWTNQSGGQFLFQPTVAGSNPNDPDGFTGNLFRLNRDCVEPRVCVREHGLPARGTPRGICRHH